MELHRHGDNSQHSRRPLSKEKGMGRAPQPRAHTSTHTRMCSLTGLPSLTDRGAEGGPPQSPQPWEEHETGGEMEVVPAMWQQCLGTQPGPSGKVRCFYAPDFRCSPQMSAKDTAMLSPPLKSPSLFLRVKDLASALLVVQILQRNMTLKYSSSPTSDGVMSR